MDQSITLKIAGKEYPLKVQNPEMEQLMRKAAEDINGMLARYNEKFPEKSVLDKLVFVTLNETVSKLASQKKILGMQDELNALQNETTTYLAEIKLDR